jgi:hypothetical protein
MLSAAGRPKALPAESKHPYPLSFSMDVLGPPRHAPPDLSGPSDVF